MGIIKKETLTQQLLDELLWQVKLEMNAIMRALVRRAKEGDMAAIKEITERIMGKVKEDFTITAKSEGKLQLTDEQLAKVLQAAALNHGPIITAEATAVDPAGGDNEGTAVQAGLPDGIPGVLRGDEAGIHPDEAPRVPRKKAARGVRKD